MGIARKEVAVKMGLGEDGLDEKRWKGLVKEHVTAALVGLTFSNMLRQREICRRNGRRGRKTYLAADE